MTDNEIIKALECCLKGCYAEGCDDCPLYEKVEDCEIEIPIIALDLINRQKEEIERLKAMVEVPAADVAEVKYGQNLNRKYIAADEFRCSECGIHLEDWAKCVDEENDVWGEYEFKFCPNCGAKMEGDAN